jgi:hypothetical protein
LDLINVMGYATERLVGVRQRQEIVEKCGIVSRPGKMLGEACRVEPLYQTLEAVKVIFVEGAFAANRQTNAMHRDRETFGKVMKLGDRASSIAHVVLGMNLEPGYRCRGCEQVGEMLRLVAHPRKGREAVPARRDCVEHLGFREQVAPGT